MTPERAKELLPIIIQAYAEGKTIQISMGVKWADIDDPVFDSDDEEYRIKPEPKVIWVNEYADGTRIAFYTREDAIKANKNRDIDRAAVRYIEASD